MTAKHTTFNEKFDTILPEDLRQEWVEMISQWEHDKTKPNPYTHMEKGIICRFTTFETLR